MCNENQEGALSFEAAHLAVLMDLRDLLQEIRNLARCPNVQAGFVAMQLMEKRGRKKRARKN